MLLLSLLFSYLFYFIFVGPKIQNQAQNLLSLFLFLTHQACEHRSIELGPKGLLHRPSGPAHRPNTRPAMACTLQANQPQPFPHMSLPHVHAAHPGPSRRPHGFHHLPRVCTSSPSTHHGRNALARHAHDVPAPVYLRSALAHTLGTHVHTTPTMHAMHLRLAHPPPSYEACTSSSLLLRAPVTPSH